MLGLCALSYVKRTFLLPLSTGTVEVDLTYIGDEVMMVCRAISFPKVCSLYRHLTTGCEYFPDFSVVFGIDHSLE